ncbi:MAG: nuclear transport factor 2 family protein, partial [Ignavibacteriales bacterium]|nr:nuclear transport factor 2 family protein [Ignavibacteriales bacterium]
MKQAPCLICLMMTVLCFGQTKPENPALSSLVEAERAFARTSLEIGARPSFMKFFADDAVVFRPGPVRYKEAMKNVPLPANPRETTLEWEPLYADVAASGDMGYTTGPAVWTDHSPAKRPPYYGYYFSVWKKQSTGEWKVALDVGTEQPGPYTGSRTFHAPAAVKRKEAILTSSPEEHVVSLMNVEREFLEAVQKEGVSNALARYAEGEVRVYREKKVPIIGSDSLRVYFSSRPYLSQWNPMFCDVALSGDIGYVYGGYEVAAPGAAPAQI